MRNKLLLGWIVIALCPLLVWAGATMSVGAVDVARNADNTVVTIRCSAIPSISSFFQASPPRVVVDLVGAKCDLAGDAGPAIGPVSAVSASQWRNDPMIARVAIDLAGRTPYTVERVGNDVQVKFSPVAPAEAAERQFDYGTPESESEGPGSDQLVTMIVKDADVASVLQLLASQFQLNLLTTADVKATVTFQFNNVPLQTALDVLVKAGGCNYFKNGDVILVKSIKTEMKGDLETRVFNLDYAEADDIRSTVSKMMSSKGRIEISYRRVGDGGTSKRSACLIVSDYKEDLDDIAKLIAEIDQPVPQISIEAKFIETTLSGNDLYGIDWSIHVPVQAKVPDLSGFKSGADVTMPIHVGQMLLGTINLGSLSATLDLLKTRGNARLLANPRAFTLDNQTAEMTIATQQPVREVRIDPGTQAQTITWRREQIPISLTVTPHVLSDGSINMEVNPRVDAITGYVGPPNDQQPITSRREAKTQIRVRDGEVAVIGGLVKDDYSKSVKKVPVLGSIPILGPLLFTSTSITASKTDLLIFIIPHVMPAN